MDDVGQPQGESSIGVYSSRLQIFDQNISVAQNVILTQARVSLQALLARINRLRQQTASTKIKGLYPDADIPTTLSDLCFQQGIASTILFNNGPKSSRENAASYKLRMDRVAYVRARCADVSLVVLSDKGVRNSLTHIDEYLGKCLAQPNTGWLIDEALEHRNFEPNGLKIMFCRTYIKSEDLILRIDKEICVAKLEGEVKAVLAAVFGEHRG